MRNAKLGNHLKPWPNDRNMPTQHIATLLGATCCLRLATELRHVAMCWVLLAQIWPASNLSQQQPTCCNTVAKRMQHVAPNNVATCCVGIGWHVAIVWPGLYKKWKSGFCFFTDGKAGEPDMIKSDFKRKGLYPITGNRLPPSEVYCYPYFPTRILSSMFFYHFPSLGFCTLCLYFPLICSTLRLHLSH